MIFSLLRTLLFANATTGAEAEARTQAPENSLHSQPIRDEGYDISALYE